MTYDVIITGGGAAGFFAAIQIAQQDPSLHLVILEKGKDVLNKVRISGGGRCNVTHAEFIPNELARNYPRGEKELRGPFHTFCSGDTVDFFEKRGVPLKVEDDGRMFPVTDSSETIIDCFREECKRLGVEVLTNHGVKQLLRLEKYWELDTTGGTFRTRKLLMATGSSPKVWRMLSNMGIQIVEPVPSLFTFNIKDDRIKGLQGLSCDAQVQIPEAGLEAEGPVLITHWGLSGPAVLRLSAWGARDLHRANYQFPVVVNWMYPETVDTCMELLLEAVEMHPKRSPMASKDFDVPKRLWQSLLEAAGVTQQENWADLSRSKLREIAIQLTQCQLLVNGKSTFKEEFVTAGGVDLKEVNFKTFECKKYPGLFFAGEILNIDAITGGFNFQNAWTGAYIAAKAIVEGT
ncbi:NAD(P)/FAD-dependent oxidoreductase [Robertkochia marina]|uniref:NAD(P)/FAD-dependent oxidoreductase n=1 Tax=Robertkochia marina TaxID=1227945 RepID=A0A4S3M6C5_9FLAO|nr:NAD(P)/FAD-dependent oxidoreductase [Robertkochia marina]THD69777.1 NAD(P)/FAD-dependent oxidoreductase [Robertkochia marina]TRZ46879.1 NAD(P)/FAD-dependent oxidoreductase [Robertkochia marina]